MLFHRHDVYNFILLNIWIVCVKNVVSRIQQTGGEYVSSSSGNYSTDNLNLSIYETHNWFASKVKYGPVTGVAVDKHGNIHVLHRENRTWNRHTFNNYNEYIQRDLGPIMSPTIFVIDSKSGVVFHQWGIARFFMPHGITVDHEDNVWITDVALHQVFKFPPKGPYDVPLLTLGSAFQPGRNHSVFCKPTSVAVLKSGSFYVADGYCNSRIIKYASDGTFLTEFGRSSYGTLEPYFFNIPHGLTLVDDKNLLCVADRENGRIQCFNADNGSFVYDIRSPKFGFTIYDIAYSPANGGLFYAINGVSTRERVYGYVISSVTRKVIAEFHPGNKSFTTSHCIAVSNDGSSIYVGELSPAQLWKFHVDGLPYRRNVESDHHDISSTSQSSLLDIIDVKSVVEKPSGPILIAILICAAILLFAFIFLLGTLVYSRIKRRGHRCKTKTISNSRSIGRSRENRFKVSNLLRRNKQHHRGDGFMKLRTTNYEESEDDDINSRRRIRVNDDHDDDDDDDDDDDVEDNVSPTA